MATLPGHEGSFKSHKKAFLNDPKCQKRGFLGLGLVDRLDISYYDKTTSLIDRIDFKLHNLIVKKEKEKEKEKKKKKKKKKTKKKE